jgi:4-amino-4-deoxychorismate lyase
MSNLFLVRDGALLTPRLDACGVAGIMRSVILELAGVQGIAWQRASLLPQDLANVEEVFVCNSLIGIWPVVGIDAARRFAVGPVTRRLQQALARDDTTRAGPWYSE